jgi:hypothetical protein
VSSRTRTPENSRAQRVQIQGYSLSASSR